MTDQPADAQPIDGTNLTEQSIRALEAERDGASRELAQAWDALARAGVVDPDPNVEVAEAIGRLTAERDNARTIAQQAGTEIYRLRVELDEANAQCRRLNRELDDTRAEITDAWAAINTTGRANAGSIAEHITRLADDLETARQTIAAQAAQLRANGTLLVRLRNLDEQRDRVWAEHDTAGAAALVEPDGDNPDDALEHAESALIDGDDSVWWPRDGGLWTTRYLEPMTRDAIEETFGGTRAVLVIDIEQDEAEAPLGSPSPRAQDAALLALVPAEARRQAEVGNREPHESKQTVSSVIAVPSRFARATSAPHAQNESRDWVRLRTGSGRQYEGHRSPFCRGDGVAGHQHDIRCVERES
ncbi:hypothetical protein AB0A95_30950 [Micromonospora sp. NPDC049230]|uniref:hypothetical protein n=1 Tax=Micromonospora sp. NPDC049230 TaxID=3155502 RepID=UPI0033C5BD58